MWHLLALMWRRVCGHAAGSRGRWDLEESPAETAGALPCHMASKGISSLPHPGALVYTLSG